MTNPPKDKKNALKSENTYATKHVPKQVSKQEPKQEPKQSSKNIKNESYIEQPVIRYRNVGMKP